MNLLVGAPRSRLRHAGLVGSLHACLGLLASTRRVWTADHFPLASVVAQCVSDLNVHGEHASGARWLGRRHPRERRLDGLRYGLGLLALVLLAFRHLGHQDDLE